MFFVAGATQPDNSVSDSSTQYQISAIQSGSQEVMPTESNNQEYAEIR